MIPAALRVVRLNPIRDYTVLGDLANEVGWKHQDLVKKLEDKRRTKADAYYQKKQARDALKAKATAAAESELAEVNKVLAASGY